MTYTLDTLEDALNGFEAERPYNFWSSYRQAFVSGVQSYDGWNGLVDFFESDPDKAVPLPGLGLLRAVELDTGGEGHGEDIHVILSVTEDDGTIRLFQKDGYYSSYGGSNWDGVFYEVRPTQVLRTIYQAV